MGRNEELALIFSQHHDFVWRSLRAMGVTAADVDDATQDVFLVVARKLESFDGRAPLRAWVYGIARNVAAKYRSRRARALEAEIPSGTVARAEEQVALSEAAALVASFLDTLVDEQRDVFVLADVEGLPAPEIAQALEVPINTVYSRLRIARARFHKFVQRHRARETRRLLPHG